MKNLKDVVIGIRQATKDLSKTITHQFDYTESENELKKIVASSEKKVEAIQSIRNSLPKKYRGAFDQQVRVLIVVGLSTSAAVGHTVQVILDMIETDEKKQVKHGL